MLAYIQSKDEPALRRATVLEQQGLRLAQQQPALVAKLTASPEPPVRESAFRILRHGSTDVARPLATRGLSDTSLAVRLAAFESLVWLGLQLDSQLWQSVQEEYEHFLDMQSDLPSGLVLKARYLMAMDYVYKAGKALEAALAKDLGYAPATILLTDILRAGRRNLEAVEAINRTLAVAPANAQLVHLRGLIQFKLKDYPKALEDLERAAELAQENWLFGYRYAVALFQLNQIDKARQVAMSVRQRFPDNANIQALMKHF